MKLTQFATIALLSMMLVAGMGCADRGKALYEQDRIQIEAAVEDFYSHPYGPPVYLPLLGQPPTLNASVITVDNKEYYTVAICPLLTSSFLWTTRGILEDIPNTVHYRNCLPEGDNARPNVTDCSINCSGSYVWLTTITGDIASICVGERCKAHGEDGYQDVYP
jgi:hypothetical protein